MAINGLIVWSHVLFIRSVFISHTWAIECFKVTEKIDNRTLYHPTVISLLHVSRRWSVLPSPTATHEQLRCSHACAQLLFRGYTSNWGKQKPFQGGPRIWEVVGRTTASHSPTTLSITTPSPPSQTSLHLTLTARDTFFLTKGCCRLIFKPFFPLLLISFSQFTFPSASCSIFLLWLHWLPTIFKVVNIDHRWRSIFFFEEKKTFGKVFLLSDWRETCILRMYIVKIQSFWIHATSWLIRGKS